MNEQPKRRRRLWWLFWLFVPVLAVVIIGVALVFWMIRREPEFYRTARANLEDVTVREAAANEFEQKMTDLIEDIRKEKSWHKEFRQDEVNAWLIDELPNKKNLPKQLRDPLVEFDTDTVRIGCYVETEMYTGMVSVSTKPTLVDEHSLMLEVESIQAGSLSVPASSLLQQAVQYLASHGAPIAWSGDEEHDRVTITFESTSSEVEGVRVTAVTLTKGLLRLEGVRDDQRK